MGLGSCSVVSLEEARKRSLECRRLLDQGTDPIEARNSARLRAGLEKARQLTFRDCAVAYVEAHRSSWRNEKHAAQWSSTLETYAYPIVGELSVQAIDTALVSKVLSPIWSTKPETASRLRGRIEAILDWATVRGIREGDNPARWRGHLAKLFPAPSKVRKIRHHAALPFDEVPAFLASLHLEIGCAARALEFTILTAARTAETIGATRSEVCIKTAVWTVPGTRMKAGRDHRVPLSRRALELLETDAGEGFLFPGPKPESPLSNMAMLKVLHRMGYEQLTVHGFRSSFRDWAAECTNFPSEAVEMALAHAVGDKVEAAYRRGDLFEKRRHLMLAWTNFCLPSRAQPEIVALRSAS
jgi:integrase